MARNGVYSKRLSPLTRAKRGIKRRWRAFNDMSKKKKTLIIGGPILAFMILVPLITYAYYYNTITDQQKLMNANNTGVVLTDKNGKAFFTIGRAKHREIIDLNKVSPNVKEALIATEDKDFYKHSGFSVAGIFRAFYGNLLSGSISGGGSTISQQLAKNLLLSQNQTILRKYQELTISIAIEQRYSKDEILAMYLSSVFFGGTNFGIDEAAKFYFNTTPDKLDLAQSAMIVGILPAPNAYSPTLGNIKYAKQRQKTVLSRMVKENYISQAEADAAYGQKLAYAEPEAQESSEAPHFAEMVMSELYEKYGEEKVLRSGYQVKTSLDLGMQRQLAANIQNHMGYIQTMGGSNASGMAIDPTNGQIRALVGSADWNNEKWGKVNMATTARQPGSSFKTIYYAQALADGVVTPATLLDDKPTDFGGYTPRNADGNFRGNVTVRQSIGQSLNIPSVEIMQKLGVNSAMDGAERFGITTLDKSTNYGLPLALGSGEIPLDQMTNAYAALANEGALRETTSIVDIRDKFDDTIYTPDQKTSRAISKQGAFLISNILADQRAKAPIFGGSLSVPGKSPAVKTGTTDDSRDAWTIGYTPKVALGVWVGNNDNAVMQSGGSDMAGPIWTSTMGQYLANQPDQPWNTPPDGVVQRAVCYGTGNLASQAGTNTYNEYFLSTNLPRGNCEGQQKVTKIKVCDLTAKRMVEINEDDFDSNKYSKNARDCEQQEKTISVCDTTSGQIVEINESEFDSSQYSRNTQNCQPPEQQIQVCDLMTNEVVTIDESEFDPALYSKDLSRCENTDNPTDPVPLPGGNTEL